MRLEAFKKAQQHGKQLKLRFKRSKNSSDFVEVARKRTMKTNMFEQRNLQKLDLVDLF